MIVIPAGVQVHLALGYTDMRKGLDGLATLIQEHLKKDPFSGHLFVFRGKNASLLRILFWDGTGLCLFTKRIRQVRKQGGSGSPALSLCFGVDERRNTIAGHIKWTGYQSGPKTNDPNRTQDRRNYCSSFGRIWA